MKTQERFVKYLRDLANMIEKVGIIESTVSVSIEKDAVRIGDGYCIRYEPALGRTINIKFTYANPPVFTMEDNNLDV